MGGTIQSPIKKMDIAKNHIHANNVWIIDKAFYIPQLNRYRRIWLYLPQGYTTSKEKYPVLYMQDGQNLFEEWSAFSEEWGVDETLNEAGGKCIVVGIDNGIEKRMNEYTMEDNEKYGKGEGKAYLSFLVNTLKPYIDKTYRTKSDRDNTYVAGSSLGGLISFYAALYYPEVFGASGIFSPAFWIASNLKNETTACLKKNSTYTQRYYFYYGEKEGQQLVVTTEPIIKLVQSFENNKVSKVVKKEGTHSEAEWRDQFPHFYNWIMGEEIPKSRMTRKKKLLK
jgi:predicted alpha/beta superfamily hydrolase